MKKFLSTILVLVLFMSIYIIPVNAKGEIYVQKDISYIQSKSQLISLYDSMQKMKESDLQEIIMNVSRPQIKKHNLKSVMVSSLPLQAAWLAAAQIAKLRGYKLSAKLVECSVLNNNYSETNGMFAKAIKKTRLWKTMKNRNNGSVAFTKAINADLFYSLHRCNYHTQSKKIIVTDLYDFKLENSYKCLFSSLVNNWAYLNQNLSVLHKIKVKIAISR